MTASARSPRARAASAATSDESTPPENATTALPSRATLALELGEVSVIASLRARRRAPAAHTALTARPRARARPRAKSSCSGATLTTSPSSRPSFTRTGSPPTSTVRLSRSSSKRSQRARCGRRACSSRAASRSRRPLVAGPRERGQHDARAALLHLHRRGPDVERAGVDAGGSAASGTSSGSRSSRLPRAATRAAARGRVGSRRRSRGRRSGARRVARAGAVADRLERHRGERAVARRRARRRAPRRSA